MVPTMKRALYNFVMAGLLLLLLALTPVVAIGAGVVQFCLTFYIYPKAILTGAKRKESFSYRKRRAGKAAEPSMRAVGQKSYVPSK
jgi:hypothetical protein